MRTSRTVRPATRGRFARSFPTSRRPRVGCPEPAPTTACRIMPDRDAVDGSRVRGAARFLRWVRRRWRRRGDERRREHGRRRRHRRTDRRPWTERTAAATGSTVSASADDGPADDRRRHRRRAPTTGTFPEPVPDDCITDVGAGHHEFLVRRPHVRRRGARRLPRDGVRHGLRRARLHDERADAGCEHRHARARPAARLHRRAAERRARPAGCELERHRWTIPRCSTSCSASRRRGTSIPIAGTSPASRRAAS